MPRPRAKQTAAAKKGGTEMPGGEMVEPAKGAKRLSAKAEMPGADMNVPVDEEVAATASAAAGPRRVTSARKRASKPAARRPAAKKKTGGSK